MPVRLPRAPVPKSVIAAKLSPENLQTLAFSSLYKEEPEEKEETLPPQTVCSGCGLSEAELNETGVFGCARCYETFVVLLAAAVEELHGVRVPQEFYETPPPHRAITMPWPTRRGIRL